MDAKRRARKFRRNQWDQFAKCRTFVVSDSISLLRDAGRHRRAQVLAKAAGKRVQPEASPLSRKREVSLKTHYHFNMYIKE